MPGTPLSPVVLLPPGLPENLCPEDYLGCSGFHTAVEGQTSLRKLSLSVVLLGISEGNYYSAG